jgi:hypothetical protein
LHYIFDSEPSTRPQTRINKGSLLFVTLQTVEDGPKHRRIGYGSGVMCLLQQEAKNLGIKTLRADVYKDLSG